MPRIFAYKPLSRIHQDYDQLRSRATYPHKMGKSLIGKAVANGSHQQNQKSPTREVWAKVLGLDSASAQFLVAFARLSSLVARTGGLVRELGIGQAQVGELEKLRAALDPALLNQPWANVSVRFEQSVMVYLSLTSDVLDRLAPEADLTEDDLAPIREALEELIRQVEEAEIDEALRDFLLRQMQKCQAGLREHAFSGARAPKEAVESVIGALLIPPDTLDASAAKETPAFKNFWTWISRLSQLIGLAKRIDALSSGQGIGGLLGS